jgi:class 3 adenylate cyclase/tetratricopeptide (TPR) repeat protein
VTAGCTACGSALPAGARFCPSCGAALLAGAAGERRVVTVAFADLAGFTTMAEGRDPEAVKELLDGCFGVLVPVIEAHGGTVDKIIGDELMAVWGAPRAHEDDAERAVRAALALLEALEQLDAALEMRVGLNTGEVLAGPVGPGGAYTVTGDTVNTAHRLVGVATRGSVLVGERTHALTREAITFGAPSSFALRGKREPVVAYPALRARHRPGERIAAGERTPMLGRDAELAQLLAAVADAGTTGAPWHVTVVGEPGLGKSRLVDELAPTMRRLGVGGPVVRVACAAYGSEGPLVPLAGIVRAVLGVEEGRPAHEQRAAVASGLERLRGSLDTDRRYLAHRTLQLLGLADLPEAPVADRGPNRGRLSEELTTAAGRIVEAAAEQAELTVVVDDAHAADPLVLDVLERLGSTGGQRALVLVVVGRDDLLDLRPALAEPRGPRALLLRLQPLDDAAARELLLRTLAEVDGHHGTLAAPVEGQILRAAGGNPLLLDQLVRFLRETGSLEAVEGGWRATGDLAHAGLPDDARALLGARLDGLPDDERRAVQAAAIVGRTFAEDAVRALDPSIDRPLLVQLERRGLLLHRADASAPGVWEFRHLMVRDAAYASVPLGERASNHARVARWLLAHGEAGGDGKTSGPDGGEAFLAQLAHHTERAVSLWGELGAPPEALPERATGSLVRAARAARQRDELQEAERWYRRAIDLGLVDGADPTAVALEHGATLLALRRLPEAALVLEEVASRTADAAVRGEAHTGLGVAARLQGDIDGARAHFEAGRQAWQSAADPLGEAASVRTHGWAELVAGRPRAALSKLLRARELEEGLGQPRGITLQCLAWCEYLLGDHQAARSHIWDAARLLSAEEDRLGLGWCFGILGNSLWLEGRVRQARQVAENLLEASRGLGDLWGEGQCLVLLAACHLEAGDAEEAGRCTGEALRTFAELDDRWGGASARLVQGMVERVAGDLGAARATLERGLEEARQVNAVGTEARLRAELAATLLDAGATDAAAREARTTLALVRSGAGDRDSEIRALVVLAKRARTSGDDPDAAVLLDEAVTLAAGDVRTSIWRRAVAWSAIVSAEGGAVDQAERLAAAALRGSWESARTWVLAQRAVAAAQRAAGNDAGALATLDAVLGRFGDRPLAFLDVVRDDIQRMGA